MENFINLSESVHTAVRIAKSHAREYRNGYYSPAHLLLALLHREIGLKGFLESMGKDFGYLTEWARMRIDNYPKAVDSSDIQPDQAIGTVFEQADNACIKLGLLEINPVCVLAALARPGTGFSADQLKSFPLREHELMEFYTGAPQASPGIPAQEESGAPMVNLLKYCTDKTALAGEERIHPVVGREKETRMMMEILGRHSKPNVMIVGDSGVGKTALVDGLAHGIVSGGVPSFLQGTTVYELDTGALIAGATYKGEIEDRLKNIIKELEGMDNTILFIDEIHVLLDPRQGNTGAVNILKPELSKGALTVIGATTMDEYRKWVEPDNAFSRRFEVLQVEEPPVESAIEMVRSVLPRYQAFHGLDISPGAIEECVRLARRYDRDRRQPYSVVLFDEIEKAHQSVYDIFLQIMDEGKLHDRLGKEGDFSNAIILFTSNVAGDWLSGEIDKGRTPSPTGIMEVMGRYFRPEFLARLSEIVPFSPINGDMLLRIFEIQLQSLTAALQKQGIGLEIEEETKKMLACKGFTPKYGARQVAATIRTHLRRPISRMIVGNRLTAGQKLIVGTDEHNELSWTVRARED